MLASRGAEPQQAPPSEATTLSSFAPKAAPNEATTDSGSAPMAPLNVGGPRGSSVSPALARDGATASSQKKNRETAPGPSGASTPSATTLVGKAPTHGDSALPATTNTVVSSSRRPVDSTSSAAAHEPEALCKAAFAAAASAMRDRGLLPEDVPGLNVRLLTLEREARCDPRGLAEAESVRAELAAVPIDRDFVDRKLKRLDVARQRDGGDATIAAELMRRSQTALSYSVMGQYDSANTELNTIAQLIKAAELTEP
jgi:hypothetical protein